MRAAALPVAMGESPSAASLSGSMNSRFSRMAMARKTYSCRPRWGRRCTAAGAYVILACRIGFPADLLPPYVRQDNADILPIVVKIVQRHALFQFPASRLMC